MVSPQKFDELDKQIVDLLSKDARVSKMELANALGITEGTVRGRLRRLEREGLIAFTAITSLELANKSQLVFINIQADVSKVREAANVIAKLPIINAVMIKTGKFNILALSQFNHVEDIISNATDEILRIDGVHLVETAIAAKTVKYNSRVVKITKPHT